MNVLKECPYNKNHKIQQHKFMAHIFKCGDKKNFKSGEIITCKANNIVRYHMSDKLTHDLDCKACSGQKMESLITTDISIIDESNTQSKIELNFDDSLLIFDPKDDFYKNNTEEKSNLDIKTGNLDDSNKENTILY